MNIAENTMKLLQEIPDHVQLVAVSKTKSNEEIMEAYHAGQRIFGENKIQDLVAKYKSLPKDISWHMIGHVQSNKVKYMASFVDLIHGVDSLKLFKEINKHALKNKRHIRCLLQLDITEESTKFGFSEEEALEALAFSETLENVEVIGLMGIATFTDNKDQITNEFKGLKSFYDQLCIHYTKMTTLSTGMSGDYTLAIAQGSNMIRVGSKIFGTRNY